MLICILGCFACILDRSLIDASQSQSPTKKDNDPCYAHQQPSCLLLPQKTSG